MVQIAMLLFAFPLAAFFRNRLTAYLVTAALFGILLIPQTISVSNDGQYDASYWVVQAITAVVAYGLLRWGASWGTKRRARKVAV